MEPIHTPHEIDPEEIGIELVRLINESAERTGRRHHDLVAAIRRKTGVSITVADGRLNATEDQLRAIAPYIKGIREYCETRTVLGAETRAPTPAPSGKKQSTLAQVWDRFWEHPILFGVPLMAVFAVWMAMLHPTSPSTLERAETKASSGRATEMTNAEADAFRTKQASDAAQHKAVVEERAELKRSTETDTARAVYRYMRRRFESLGDSYNPDVHDAIIANDAAAKFGITASEANSIYYRLDY